MRIRHLPVAPSASAAMLALSMLLFTSVVHAQDEAPTAPEESGWDVGYGPKGVFIESRDGNYAFGFSTLAQPRFEFTRVDGVEDVEDETNARFLIRRLRPTVKGHIFSPSISYKLQLGFGRGAVELKDLLIDFALEEKWFSIMVGQFKRPTSRQFLNSASRLELVDRALSVGAFEHDRDLGFAIHNGTGDAMFEYSLGLYNGTTSDPEVRGDVEVDPTTGEGEIVDGGTSNLPTTFNPAIVARIGFNQRYCCDDDGDLTLINRYAEPDLEGGPFRFGAGASGFIELDVDDDGHRRGLASADVIAKWAGVSLSGEGQLGIDWFDDDDDVMSWGAHGQLGYAIMPGSDVVFQPVARYSFVDSELDFTMRQEAGGGLSVYFRGHRLKLQADAFALIEEAPQEDPVDARVRAQLQLKF